MELPSFEVHHRHGDPLMEIRFRASFGDRVGNSQVVYYPSGCSSNDAVGALYINDSDQLHFTLLVNVKLYRAMRYGELPNHPGGRALFFDWLHEHVSPTRAVIVDQILEIIE